MKEKIQDLIAKGKLAEALSALAIYNEEAILFQSQHNKLEKDARLGLLDHATYTRELNKINYSVLSTLNETDFAKKTEPEKEETSTHTTPPKSTSSEKSVFFSYAHEDKDLQKRLRVHLAPLRRSDKINDWSDEEVKAGSEWDAAIKHRLHSADIILLLVSPYFIDSDYIWDTELKIAMERHERKEAVVVPIILKSCQWHDMPFGKLQALPRGGQPVTEWGDADQAFFNVAEGIKRLL